jgi:uncharacterized UPF0160 family protein
MALRCRNLNVDGQMFDEALEVLNSPLFFAQNVPQHETRFEFRLELAESGWGCFDNYVHVERGTVGCSFEEWI